MDGGWDIYVVGDMKKKIFYAGALSILFSFAIFAQAPIVLRIATIDAHKADSGVDIRVNIEVYKVRDGACTIYVATTDVGTYAQPNIAIASGPGCSK